MSVSFKLAWRALRQNLLTTWIAVFTISLSGSLFMGAWKTKQSVKVAFAQSAGGFDAVLGARGSQLQLVLNALFHMENSPGIWLGSSMSDSIPPRSGRGISFCLGGYYLGTGWLVPPQLICEARVETGKKYQVKKAWKNIF